MEAEQLQQEPVEESGSVLSGEQSAPPLESWIEGIPEEYRGPIIDKGFKDPADLAKAHYNLTRLHRGNPNVLEMPSEDATPEQLGNFYSALGRPGDVDGYQINVPEGMQADDQFMGAFKNAAFEAGMSQKAVSAMSDFWHNHIQSVQAEAEQQAAMNFDSEMNELQKEWGQAYDQKINMGKQAVQMFNVSDDALNAIQSAIGPKMMAELFANIGEKLGEDNFVAGKKDDSFGRAMSPKEASSEIQRLQTDAEFVAALMDKAHPNHARNQQKWRQLQQYAFEG